MKFRIVGLTKRERECVHLIMESYPSNAEIAREMDIKPATVNMFLNRIYRESDIDVKRNHRREELMRKIHNGELIIVDKTQG